ncbi:MAG: HEAT repeat domain-containing protein [Chloroflexi bacterium]|nr:HEAT repeat domain-containing protein [Chloroflexota bacterium]
MGLNEFLETVPNDEGGQFTYAGLSELSGLSGDDARDLAEEWEEWTEARLVNFLHRLVGLSEDDALLEFDTVFKQALSAQSAPGRKLALTGLAECDDRSLVSRLLKLVKSDPSDDIREDAALALARFAALGVAGKLLKRDVEKIGESLDEILANARETDGVRRRALEASATLGATNVDVLIKAAFDSGNIEEVKSALYSMGLSSNQAWLPQVLQQITSASPELRFEAARALGEIGEEPHIIQLADLLEDADPVVAVAAIGSLARIGGDAAVKLIQGASESEHTIVAEASATALREIKMENILYEDEPGIFGITPELESGVEVVEDPEADLEVDEDADEDWKFKDYSVDEADGFDYFDDSDDSPLLIGEFEDDEDSEDEDDEPMWDPESDS